MASAKDIRQIEMEERGGALGSAIFRNINTRTITGTSEISQFPTTFIGSLNLSMDDLTEIGRIIQIIGFGTITTTASPGQATIRLKIGATTILLNSATLPTAAITDGVVRFELLLTITDNGKVRVSGKSILETTSGGGGIVVRALNTATDQTIVVTSPQVLDYTYQFANTGNTLTIRDIKVIKY